MQNKVIFIIDKHPLHPRKDSTVALMETYLNAKWDILICHVDDFIVKQNALSTRCHTIKASPNALSKLHSQHFFGYSIQSTKELLPLALISTVWIRLEPPVHLSYVHLCQLLHIYCNKQTHIFNRPTSLLAWNEKISIGNFPQHAPPFMIVSHYPEIINFCLEHRNIVLKPLNGFGGQDIHIFKHPFQAKHLKDCFNTLIQRYHTPLMLQRYLESVRFGDKRVLMINGEPIQWVLKRVPLSPQHKGNLSMNAVAIVERISPNERRMLRTIGQVLKKRGLVFVGMDIIGQQVSEINVTCPTGIREIYEQTGYDASKALFKALHHPNNPHKNG